MAVELALTPDSRCDVELSGLVEAARGAGFTSLGIHAGRVDAAAVSSYSAAGLRCHELMALVIEDDAEATSASAERLAHAAAVIGVRWVNTVFRAATGETPRLVERCAAILAEVGTGLAVEFSPLGALPSIGAGLDMVAVAGADRAGLLLDTWHFSCGDSTWEELGRVPTDRIAYIQFNDGLTPESDNLWTETLHRRVMPGDGVFELERFASTLLERGFEGVVSVEVLNAELRKLPASEFACRAYESTRRYWG